MNMNEQVCAILENILSRWWCNLIPHSVTRIERLSFTTKPFKQTGQAQNIDLRWKFQTKKGAADGKIQQLSLFNWLKNDVRLSEEGNWLYYCLEPIFYYPEIIVEAIRIFLKNPTSWRMDDEIYRLDRTEYYKDDVEDDSFFIYGKLLQSKQITSNACESFQSLLAPKCFFYI